MQGRLKGYGKGDPTADGVVPIPVLGPDLVDMRQLDLIRQQAAKVEATAVAEPETEAATE